MNNGLFGFVLQLAHATAIKSNDLKGKTSLYVSIFFKYVFLPAAVVVWIVCVCIFVCIHGWELTQRFYLDMLDDEDEVDDQQPFPSLSQVWPK